MLLKAIRNLSVDTRGKLGFPRNDIFLRGRQKFTCKAIKSQRTTDVVVYAYNPGLSIGSFRPGWHM